MTYENPESVAELVQIYGGSRRIVAPAGNGYEEFELGAYADDFDMCPSPRRKEFTERQKIGYLAGALVAAGELQLPEHAHLPAWREQ